MLGQQLGSPAASNHQVLSPVCMYRTLCSAGDCCWQQLPRRRERCGGHMRLCQAGRPGHPVRAAALPPAPPAVSCFGLLFPAASNPTLSSTAADLASSSHAQLDPSPACLRPPALQTLPGFLLLLPTVQSGWCLHQPDPRQPAVRPDQHTKVGALPAAGCYLVACGGWVLAWAG